MKHPTRLSRIEMELLRLLTSNGEMYGLELVHGSDILKRGSVYVMLNRLADKGLVVSRHVKPLHEGGLPRRLFWATKRGSVLFHACESADAVFREAMAGT